MKVIHRWLSGFLVLFPVILDADPAIGAMSEVWTARYDAASLVVGEAPSGSSTELQARFMARSRN